jgi:hypothetical protein
MLDVVVEEQDHLGAKRQQIKVVYRVVFFSENNGFYLAVNPEDYRRVVRPSRWESEEAQEARR